MVAQVNKHKVSMIADIMNPAGQADFFADIPGAKL
jgi:hypothetical protein